MNIHTLRASLALAITFLAIHAVSTNDTNSTDTTQTPTIVPTQLYTTGFPTLNPTIGPIAPTTSEPTTDAPSKDPTMEPTTGSPTTASPTTAAPTEQPTVEPTTASPTTPSPTTAAPTTANPTTSEPSVGPTATIITTGSPTIEPTVEPTVEPTLATSASPTAAPTDPTYTEVLIEITISFASTNATEAELAELILLAIDELVLSLNLTVLAYDADDFTVELIEADSDTDTDASRRRLLPPVAATYIFRITLSVLNEADQDSAAALIDSIESGEFAAALIADIEANTYSEVDEDGLRVSATAVSGETDDDDDDVDWLDWRTWQFINWLIVGGVALVLCVLGLCLARCCCLFCCCAESRERRKSQYRLGGQMFDRVDSHNTGKEKQFQSDLRQAIEMNKRGTLLKKGQQGGGGAADEELLDLDAKDVGAAFDMNFDEKTPIKEKESAKASMTSDAGSVKTDKGKKGKKAKGKKGSEGGDETGDALMRGATPGGPDDDDAPVPPAPGPPKSAAMEEEEEHAAAYDLL